MFVLSFNCHESFLFKTSLNKKIPVTHAKVKHSVQYCIGDLSVVMSPISTKKSPKNHYQTEIMRAGGLCIRSPALSSGGMPLSNCFIQSLTTPLCGLSFGVVAVHWGAGAAVAGGPLKATLAALEMAKVCLCILTKSIC